MDFVAIYKLSFIHVVNTKIDFSAVNVPEMHMGAYAGQKDERRYLAQLTFGW